jgi:signal transduction histidine kinase
LKGGRHLVAVASNKGFHPVRSLHFAAVFLGIAWAIAIGFYPLIRHLMRRLEELETGVALFGAGNLSARVQVKGHDEIAKLAAIFNASADRLEILMNAHKLLLAHASHELRSPLSRLKMAIDRLQRNPGDQGAGAEAARNIGELDALVEEILLASRLQASGGSTLAIEPVDIAGLLAEECAAYQAEVTVADSSAPLVQGDTRLLRRLFRNLLENASAYGGGEAPEVTLSSTEAEILVFVCDRGAGVPEGEREKIFEPFYQLPRRMKGGGTGLGLALVRQIAAQHGGQVRYLARDGGGACFEVRLARSMS